MIGEQIIAGARASALSRVRSHKLRMTKNGMDFKEID
jgi:hypothetical protein